MSKFQLYIADQRVELFDDENVSLTQTIQNIRDISKVFTDFTKPFTLPASDINNKIFKHYYRFNLVQGYTFDARKKIDAKIELNSIPFRDGKIRLEGVNLVKGKPESYRITFFGNTVNLKDTLKDDKINGLTWLNNFNLDYDASKIQEILNTPTGFSKTIGTDVYSAAVIVPLISNTVRLWYDSSPVTNFPYLNSEEEVNVANGGNLYPTNAGSETANDVHGVYFEDLTYAVKVHLIVKAIENQYASITFSDDFFDLTNGSEAYKNLYMLCQNKEGRVFEDLGIAERLITGFPTTQANHIVTNDSRIIIFGLNNSQSVLGKWTIQTQQTYPNFTVVLRDGGEVVFRREFLTQSTDIAIFSQQLTNSSEGYTVTIETESAFDILSVTFEGTDTSGNILTSQTTVAIPITLTKEFIISQNLPNMNVIDFLTGLFKMFNLTAYEVDGIIHVQTLESYYLAGTVRDITKFVDPQSIQVDKALPYEEIKFEYKDTGTILANQHDQISSVGWGSLNYVETGGLDSNNETFSIEAPFAHLKYERLVDPNASADPVTDIQWGWMANESSESYFEDAVLFIGKYVSLPITKPIRFLQTKNSTGGIVPINDIWIPSNSVSLDAATNKETINFGLEINEWTTGNNFTDSLFEKYYRFYIAGVFNQSKRLTKITARLPKKFVINYTLADIVVINNDRYRINSITTNLLSGSSQLELLNETVNDTLATQPDAGGDEGQGGGTGVPLTNVLTLFQCDSPNSTFESSLTLADLNLSNNTRVVDTSGNTFRVTGNNVPNTHTIKIVSSTGLTGCPSGSTPNTTNYYGLERCSDNETNLRTASVVGSPTYVTSQVVFDGASPAVKYVVSNAVAQATVPAITIASSPSNPKQFTCSTQTTTNYYQLNPCCSGTTFIGFSANASLSGSRLYNNQTYVISPSNTSGGIDIDSLPTSSCQIYYYTLNDCTNQSTIVHYGYSNCSNLNNTELTYSSTCYHVATTSNTTATVNLDSLSSCTCGGTPPPPALNYYVLQHCDTGFLYVTTTTTDDITLTQNATPANASLVTDTNGVCYTVNSTTTDPTTFATDRQIGAVSSENQLGCPATSCTQTLYYALQQCSTGNSGFISTQTTLEVSYNTNDMVKEVATPSVLYKVIGTTSSGTGVNVTASTATQCPSYYTLTQCYTNQTGYRTGQFTTDISLSNGDRVQAPDGQPYTVTGTVGGGLADVGTVTDTGQTGCPTIDSSTQFYALTRCADASTGYLSLQRAADLNLNVNDTVTIQGGDRYQVVGTDVLANGSQIGAVASDGGNNCLTPVVPPVPPTVTTVYARFITCDDPTGAVINVSSTQAIGTWWVISEVGQFECYRWLDNNQGVNPIELNNSNFNFYAAESTAGANCLDCQSNVPIAPPPPPPSAPSCFTVNLYKSATVLGLCTEVNTRTMYLNASTLAAASQVYTDDACGTLLSTDQYISNSAGGVYWFWNASAQTLTGSFTLNCP